MGLIVLDMASRIGWYEEIIVQYLVRASAVVLLLSGFTDSRAAAPPRSIDRPGLAIKAEAILRKHCYRCHGQDGAVEGGFNYILEHDKLVSRRKIVSGRAEESPLYRRVASGKMPPVGEPTRPDKAQLAILRDWIEAGAPGVRPSTERKLVQESAVLEWILADLDQLDRRARRFTRYFSLASLANGGAGVDELKTYRNALAKLLNSLSWHPKINLPKQVDPDGLVLRIDLRDYQFDANSWNRLLNDYPYGILHDSAVSRAVLIGTATRMPVVRVDWFVASASRAPLYYDLLQLPSNLSELERQLRVDSAANIQQERVARTAFNGSGISRSNRILERHDAMNGAYWRTYDFEAVPQNLLDRNILLPDRRNVFAYPIGPGGAETNFQHAGGEAIFNLPNGLQAYILVNANNVRINKGPTEIVSDPKRPDRAVEAGLSCINCHARGIIPKDDQLRDHVRKNRKAFARQDVELVEALHPVAKTMRKLMDEDAERFAKAIEKTGNKTTAAEVVMAMTLRYEADVDLATLAAELGVSPTLLQSRITGENLARNLGALKVAGGTISRQVVVQAFGDLARELRLGTALEVGRSGESLPDATGEADPLEAQSSPANAMAFSPDGKLAAFASADKSVRLFDIEAGRDLRRCIGHTASVWCVAFSPDGTRVLSGSKDGTVRLWEVESGRELLKIDAHQDLVSAVAFSPDGKQAVSAGYDHEVIVWSLEKGDRVGGFAGASIGKYIHSLAFAPDGKSILVGSENTHVLVDARAGKLIRKFDGHTGWVSDSAFSRDGKTILSASDDGTMRSWDVATGKTTQVYRGHVGAVRAVAFRGDGKQALSGGADATVRLWDTASGREVKAFRKHTDSLVAVAFSSSGRFTLSGSRDGDVRPWKISDVAIVTPIPILTKPPVENPTDIPTLRPTATHLAGGTVGRMFLSADGKWLFYHQRLESSLVKLDARTMRRVASLALSEDVETFALSPDGKRLVALRTWTKDGQRKGAIWAIDPATLKKVADVPLASSAYDLAVRDDGIVLLSGGGPEWTSVEAVDLISKKSIGTFGSIWGKSIVALTPEGGRLYVSSQGVLPGTLDRFAVPRIDRKGDVKLIGDAANTKATNDRAILGGGIHISPDGKYLLARSGTVLKISSDREDDMRPHAKVVPHLSAAIDVLGKSAYVLGRDGLLWRYSYPDFRPTGRWRPALSAHRIALDATGGMLHVAGLDPRSIGDRPRAKGHGDIHTYAIEELGPKK